MAAVVVKGMSCEHCKRSVTEAVQGIPGIKDVKVDLVSGNLTWEGDQSPGIVEKVKAAVKDIGFDHQ